MKEGTTSTKEGLLVPCFHTTEPLPRNGTFWYNPSTKEPLPQKTVYWYYKCPSSLSLGGQVREYEAFSSIETRARSDTSYFWLPGELGSMNQGPEFSYVTFYSLKVLNEIDRELTADPNLSICPCCISFPLK